MHSENLYRESVVMIGLDLVPVMPSSPVADEVMVRSNELDISILDAYYAVL